VRTLAHPDSGRGRRWAHPGGVAAAARRGPHRGRGAGGVRDGRVHRHAVAHGQPGAPGVGADGGVPRAQRRPRAHRDARRAGQTPAQRRGRGQDGPPRRGPNAREDRRGGPAAFPRWRGAREDGNHGSASRARRRGRARVVFGDGSELFSPSSTASWRLLLALSWTFQTVSWRGSEKSDPPV
jgi:hypothetical protein